MTLNPAQEEALERLRETYERHMGRVDVLTPVDDLPSMDPPGDEAGAHMVLKDNPAAGTLCGGPRNHRGHGDIQIGEGHLQCPCGVEVCRACEELAIAYTKYGRMP